jgi:hypothetical protein
VRLVTPTVYTNNNMGNDPFTTKQYVKKSLFFFISLVIIVTAGFIGYQYLTDESSGITDPLLLDQGLITLKGAESDVLVPSGYLYFHGTPSGPADVASPDLLMAQYFAMDTIETERIQLLPMAPSAEQMNNSGDQYGVAIFEVDPSHTEIDTFHPGLIDYQTNELSLLDTVPLYSETRPIAASSQTPDRQWVAYSGRATPEDETVTDIDTWQIVIYNVITDELRTIEGATNPVWLNGEADILYLTSDGIYRYNLAADASEPFDTNWESLDDTAQLAVSEDYSAAIVTVPSLNAIAVYRFTDPSNAEAEQVGIIATPNTFYYNPVLSPDGNHYAVLRTTVTDDVPRVEIRPVFERTVVDTITTPFDAAALLVLEDWREAVEPLGLQ